MGTVDCSDDYLQVFKELSTGIQRSYLQVFRGGDETKSLQKTKVIFATDLHFSNVGEVRYDVDHHSGGSEHACGMWR